jgi:hypothetical protein
MASRKTNKSSTSRNGNGSPADVIRDRFEKRLDDVRSRFKSFEKEWGTTVDKLVTRGRSAEKDLRKRLDRVAKDLNRNDLVTKVRKSSVVKKVANGDLLGAVKGLDIKGLDLKNIDRTIKGVDYQKAINTLRKDVKGFQEDVVDFFEASKSRIKQVIDLPTRGDFERLNRKIEQLSSQVRSLEKRKRA